MAAEDAQLATRESKMKMMLVSLLLRSPPSAIDPGHAKPDFETPDQDTSKWLFIFGRFYDIKGEKDWED